MSESFDYKYISLTGLQNIEITRYGKSELSGLEGSIEMPLSYELIRDEYTIVFELDKQSYWPSVFVGVKSTGDFEYSVEPVEVENCGGFENFGIEYSIENLHAKKYVWSPAFRQNCEVNDNEEYPVAQIIGFKILDQNGDTIAEEMLPFSLVLNGTYVEHDSL